MSKKILIFSPEALVAPHVALNLVIGATLRGLGHSVRVAYCHSLFQRCVSKESMNLPPGTSRESVISNICRLCSDNHTQVTAAYGLPALDLRSYHEPNVYEDMTRQLRPHRGHLQGAVYNNIRFGYIAFHDVALHLKVPLDATPDEDTQTLHEETIATLVSLHNALLRLFSVEKFDMVVVNGQYGPNITALRTAAMFGIEGRILYNPAHMNIDRRWVEVCRTEGREVDFSLLDAWPEWRRLPLDADFIPEVKRDIVVRSQGSGAHIYSPRRSVDALDLRAKLNLPADRKLVVAFTSSLDEQSAEHALFLGMERPARTPVNELFADQVEWLSFIAEKMKDRDDLQLVIRIHPREDGNQRNGRRSVHLQRLETALANVPANVRVVWPRDPVSSYDLMELADLVLTSWSTTGIECARLGIPVLGAFRGFHNIPVGDFISAADSREEYLRLIDIELGRGDDIHRILLAFRWYHVMRFVGSIWLGDVIPTRDSASLPVFRMPGSARELEAEMFGGRPPIHDHRLAVRRDLCADPDIRARLEREELDALRQELRDIVHCLMTGRTADRPLRLSMRLVDGPADPEVQPEGQALLLVWPGNWCAYRLEAEEAMRRTSPMAVRLARLCAQVVEGGDAAAPRDAGASPSIFEAYCRGGPPGRAMEAG